MPPAAIARRQTPFRPYAPYGPYEIDTMREIRGLDATRTPPSASIARRFRKIGRDVMGGIGSGRPSSGRSKVEDCRSIDINRLNRDGTLQPGWVGVSQWTSGGTVTASISIAGGRDQIVLSYQRHRSDDEAEVIHEPVRILWKACRLGGQRPYFVCPGVVNGEDCGRPAIKLYAAGRYYLCRKCYGLTYASQGETRRDRAARKARKIRRRLGGSARLDTAFPPRPTGMWRQSYERLRNKAQQSEDELAQHLNRKVESLMSRARKTRGYWE